MARWSSWWSGRLRVAAPPGNGQYNNDGDADDDDDDDDDDGDGGGDVELHVLGCRLTY